MMALAWLLVLPAVCAIATDKSQFEFNKNSLRQLKALEHADVDADFEGDDKKAEGDKKGDAGASPSPSPSAPSWVKGTNAHWELGPVNKIMPHAKVLKGESVRVDCGKMEGDDIPSIATVDCDDDGMHDGKPAIRLNLPDVTTGFMVGILAAGLEEAKADSEPFYICTPKCGMGGKDGVVPDCDIEEAAGDKKADSASYLADFEGDDLKMRTTNVYCCNNDDKEFGFALQPSQCKGA